jgi:hypothetical protein
MLKIFMLSPAEGGGKMINCIINHQVLISIFFAFKKIKYFRNIIMGLDNNLKQDVPFETQVVTKPVVTLYDISVTTVFSWRNCNEQAKNMSAVSMSDNPEVIKCIVPSVQKKLMS